MDISVIVPVFNEEKNIAPLVDELTAVLSGTKRSYEVIFVNDGSTDKTLPELEKAKTPGSAIRIIDLNRNFGQTAAIMAGFDSAEGEIIVTLDGDLQNDPRDIPLLLEKLDSGFDLVCGWRAKRNDPFFLRIIPSKIANWLIAKALKLPLHDFGCTLKAYRKHVVKGMRLYGEMHRFIPAIASWRGARITEMPVRHRPRRSGKTKYGINRTIRVFLDLLLMSFLSEYSTKPIRFFGGLGLITALLGFFSFLMVIYMRIAENINMTGNPVLILCVLFFLVSTQLFSLGFIGELNIRTYYESQNKKTYHIRKIVA